MAAMLLKRVPPPRAKRRRLRRLIFWLAGLAVLIGVMAEAVNLWMVRRESAQVFQRIGDVPSRPVAIVLGAGPSTLYLENRLDAAAELYKAGKVRLLLVSGAGNITDPTGSETYLMRQGLIARGVPAAAVVRDDDGVRTLDSMARARLVYGLNSVIVVSQDFHLPRAIYLAHAWNLDAVGFAAEDPHGDLYHSYLREWLARVLAVIDVTILNRQPHAAGPPAPILVPAAVSANLSATK